jgi:hypothetical protein
MMHSDTAILIVGSRFSLRVPQTAWLLARIERIIISVMVYTYREEDEAHCHRPGSQLQMMPLTGFIRL